MRIRSHLLLLVLVAVVPVAGIAAGLLVDQLRDTRAMVEGDMLRTARALSSTLDRHLRGSIGTLQVLATSSHLDTGDLPELERQIMAVRAQVRPEWSAVAVVGSRGEVLLRTPRAPGAAPPSLAQDDAFQTARDQARPHVSDLLEGRPGAPGAIHLAVPAVREGTVRFVLLAFWSPESLGRLVAEQPLPGGGVARVLDRRRRAIVRGPSGPGDAAAPPALDVPDAQAEGLIRAPAGAARTMYAAYARSPLSGWIVTLAVPAAVIDRPAGRALEAALATFALLLASLGLAAVLARRIAGPVGALERAARQVGRGGIPSGAAGAVTEVKAAGDALVAAATDRRRAEDRLRAKADEAERAGRELTRRQQEAEELGRLARLLTERLDLATVTDRIVGALLTLLEADAVTLWLCRDDGTRVALASAGAAREHFRPGHVLPAGLGLVGRAARESRPVWSRDVFAEPGLDFPADLRERIVASGVRALLAVPLRIGEELIGVVTVAHSEPRLYGDHEIRLAGAFADQAALALDNARRFDAESAARARAEATAARAARLQVIGSALSRGLSRTEVARIVVEQVLPALEADACSVYVLSADARALELVDDPASPGGALAEWARLPLDRAVPLADAVRDGRPWFQARRDERDERYPHLRGVPAAHEATAYVPLLLDDRPIGGLAIGFNAPRVFEVDERRFLLTAAQQCAQALDRVRLHEAERAARAHAEAAQARSAFLAEASALLASSLDGRTTLRQLARLGVPAVADWCVVYLRGDGGEIQRAEVAHADPAGLPAAERLRGPLPAAGLERDTVADRVLGDGEAVLLGEIAPALLEVPGAAPGAGGLRDLDPRSAMFVPLAGAEGPFGAIGFVVAESGRRYGPADLALAEDLARRLALALDNARLFQAANAASRAKDEFLAMLGHELRNPLGAMTNAVAVLDGLGWSRPEGLRLGQIIRRQVRHLSRLVDDLLDVSRVVTGRVSVERQRVDLGEVVERCVATLREGGLGTQHALEVRAAPAVVVGDPTRLAQVVNNLVENAAKYTPEGGRIAVDVGVEDGEAVLRVADSGIGIPAELLPHVFDPFTQERQRLDRSRGGLGIGLTLVRRLVELHGGAVTAASPGPGAGSTFVVRLPAGQGGAEAPSPVAPAGPVPPLRVLVIEDHDDARQSLRLLLERHGHTVEEAVDGPRGLERLLAARPDVALVDIGLPGLDGYEVARAARAAAGGDRLHMIALTGYGQPDDRRRAREAGFDAHLVKPVAASELTAILHGVVAPDAAADAGGSPGERR